MAGHSDNITRRRHALIQYTPYVDIRPVLCCVFQWLGNDKINSGLLHLALGQSRSGVKEATQGRWGNEAH